MKSGFAALVPVEDRIVSPPETGPRDVAEREAPPGGRRARRDSPLALSRPSGVREPLLFWRLWIPYGNHTNSDCVVNRVPDGFGIVPRKSLHRRQLREKNFRRINKRSSNYSWTPEGLRREKRPSAS